MKSMPVWGIQSANSLDAGRLHLVSGQGITAGSYSSRNDLAQACASLSGPKLLIRCPPQADFTPFEGKASLQDQAATAAALAQAAFAGHVPEGGAKGDAPAEPNTSADADLAMALQMQEVSCPAHNIRVCKVAGVCYDCGRHVNQ